MKNKKVLITGGLGFIGSNLAKKCLELGAEITIYDNSDPNSGGNLFNIELFRKDVELIVGDIIDYEYLTRIIMGKDIVINCAASTSHSYSMSAPWLNLDVNCRGVINVLEAIKQFNRSVKLVHLGTTTQLGKLRYQPADELHPEFPTDMYSANKMVAEKYVLLYANAYKLDAFVIRFPNVFGPRAAIHSPEFTFNNYFIGLALENKSITVYEPGTQLRNVLYVDDAVDSLIAALDTDKAKNEVFFAVGSEHYSVKNIAEQTCMVMGGLVEMVDWPKNRKAIAIGDAVISNKKIKDTIGWSPRVSFKDGLICTKNYYKSCLDKYRR